MLRRIARQIPQIDRLVRQRNELAREVEYLRRQLAERQPPAVPAVPPFDRRSVILKHLNLDGLGLEIGPSHSPLLPKCDGYRVEIIDCADADHLRANNRALGIATDRIEEVDYVSDSGSIFETIGESGRDDYIVASHVIEHAPDLVGFLSDCEKLLAPEGRLSLAVPDKGYHFDLFQALSTTGNALEARHARRPSPGTAFDFVANYARRNGNETWGIDDQSAPEFVHGLPQAKDLFDRMQRSDDYFDAHVWRFVPSSFRLIVSDLLALDEIHLREFSFDAPGGLSSSRRYRGRAAVGWTGWRSPSWCAPSLARSLSLNGP
jgi:SAM-dependent methyltransferase